MNQSMFYPQAVANIKGDGNASELSGKVEFYQMQNYVLILANIQGLPKTDSCFFGFHIHEGGGCGGIAFSDTGSHYNPKQLPHPQHAGDLPPLLRCKGGAFQIVATDRLKISDIIGKTVVIHNMPDDFTSQPAGNAGTKIACGVIYRT